MSTTSPIGPASTGGGASWALAAPKPTQATPRAAVSDVPVIPASESNDPYKFPSPGHHVRGAGFSTPPPRIMPDLTVPHHFAMNVPVGV